MAIKALMLRKKIGLRKASLEDIEKQIADFETRESELEKALAEATNDEETDAVEEEVNKLNDERGPVEEEKAKLEAEIEALTKELADEEAEQDTEPEPQPEQPKEAERKVNMAMDKRNIFANMDVTTRNAIFAQDDVKEFLANVRKAKSEKRAIENIGLTIPEVFLGYLRENIMDYSKLIRRVMLKNIGGSGRMVIMGGLQEAVWTECCANLNELSMTFADTTVDCFKVGGYYAICDANLMDSDINLASEILTAIGQAIGYALDKAILYGRNTNNNSKMPLGIVSRLAQTAQPSDWGATERPWADLHESNIVTLTAAQSTDLALFTNMVLATQAIDNDFSRGNITYVMNRKTYTKVLVASMGKNANAAIVAAVNGTMPVTGGDIEVLNFIPDDVIIAGYFDLYLLVEREGTKFATSEHVRFLQDQTVYKGTARYDGKPLIGEAFMAIGINGVTPTAAMTFAADTANS